MSILNEAAFVKGALEGRVIQLDVSGTSVRYSIPAAWAGQYVRAKVFADTLGDAFAVDIVFGDSAVDCTYNQDSAGTPPAITINDESGERIVNGETAAFVIPTIGSETGQATHFAVEASGAGKLQLIRG